jgi:signal transduction histidine kinase
MEEVLLLGKLDAGRMACEPEPMDLRTVLARIVGDVLAATGGQCGIDFAYQPLESSALADERLLRHVFTNLLGNAVKYSEPGGRIEFAVQRRGDDALFTVRDRGIGIPEVDQPWLFNAFHRGSNVGQRQGTGLGLVIVKRCVDLQRGTIKIESTPGAGTTVSVTLPLFRAARG